MELIMRSSREENVGKHLSRRRAQLCNRHTLARLARRDREVRRDRGRRRRRGLGSPEGGDGRPSEESDEHGRGLGGRAQGRRGLGAEGWQFLPLALRVRQVPLGLPGHPNANRKRTVDRRQG